MDSNTSLLSGITRSMKHLAERQRVIAQNIANSETPGFKAREVEKPDFSALVAARGGPAQMPRIARPQVSVTGAMVSLGATPPSSTHVVDDRDVSETKPDGNNVTLEEQLLKMGEVQADFAAMTNLYRKQMGLIKAAIGRGG